MLIYLQARQVTVADKGKGQEVQKVKERKITRIKFKAIFRIFASHCKHVGMLHNINILLYCVNYYNIVKQSLTDAHNERKPP